MDKFVIVVAAHADDEVLGCGGTIARHVAEGDVVHALFLADGVTSRPPSDNEADIRRKQASERARELLGIQSAIYLQLPDNRLDSIPLLDIVQPLETAIRRISPEIIYTHHHGDLNVDHRITHQAVMTACRPIPGNPVREIFTFEVMSSTEWNSPGLAPFDPQMYVDITPQVGKKIEALEAYRLEMRDEPHSRSIEHIRALALHRGHCVGVGAAEAFMVMRITR